MPFSNWSLKHPVPVAVITVAMVILGLLSFVFFNREFIPPVVLPTANVVTVWAGVEAGDVEENITKILEKEFSSLSGLQDMSSVSREGISIIKLNFSADMESNSIRTGLRERIDLASVRLPPDLDVRPIVNISTASDLPIFVFAVNGLDESHQVTSFVENRIVPDIYKVDGTGRVRVLGGRKKILQVKLNSQALAGSSVTASEVYGLLSIRNRVLPAGLVEWEESEWTFRISDEFDDFVSLENLIVGRGDEGLIKLSEIADISEVYEQPTERIRLQEKDVQVVQVSKLDSGNALRMSREIRKKLDKIREESGDKYSFNILHDDREIVSLALNSVLGSALTGVIMAVVMVWLFLRSWRYTLVASISLPVSIIVTFACMRLTGQSMNVLTMAGITVSLGMVVDASIVILENIYQQHLAGAEAGMAARDGASQVSSAVTASVITSVSVFAPMLFLGGIIGVIMKDLALAIILSLSVSLLCALFLVPPLARFNLERGHYQGMGRGRLMVLLERGYKWCLLMALKLRWVFVPAVVLLFVLSVFFTDRIGISFLPAANYDELYISMKQQPGSDLEDGVALADETDRLIRSRLAEVSDVLFYVGLEDDLAGEDRQREALWGHVILEPAEDRDKNFRELMDELNEILTPAFPDVSVAVFNGGFDRIIAKGTEGLGYRVELSSQSIPGLTKAAETVEKILASDPDIISVQRAVSANRRSVTMRLDGERMGQQGINALDAALTTRIMFDGVNVGKLRRQSGGMEGDEESQDRDIFLSSDMAGETPDIPSLELLKVRNIQGNVTSLNDIASVGVESGVSEIHRRNRSRTFTVIGYPRTENIRDIATRLGKALGENPLDDGVEWQIKGVSSLITDSILNLFIVLSISLFLVYGVMAVQFERFRQPLIIMVSVPFCLIGVVGVLTTFGSNLSVISFLGIVALAGIVVNNAIVQIDYINFLRKQGLGLNEAVIDGAVSRLRPILMTTLTTLFGVLPLSLAQGMGARIYAPLGQAIAGGLLSSTLVTLFLVPVLYWMIERGSAFRSASVPTEGNP